MLIQAIKKKINQLHKNTISARLENNWWETKFPHKENSPMLKHTKY